MECGLPNYLNCATSLNLAVKSANQVSLDALGGEGRIESAITK